MKEYYILSINHTRGYVVSLWRPNNSGYTIYLEQAGRYSEEQVKKNQQYYDNKVTTMAVPCEDVEKMALRSLPWENDLLSQIGVKI
jgi:hypothetical protein